MVFSFKLEEVDYHTHLLYTISKSSSANKTRALTRLLMTIALLLFAFISYSKGSFIQTIYFGSLSLLTFLLMPIYTRWSYKKTYLKHVRKFYKERLFQATSITFKNESMEIADKDGVSEINFNDIIEINELQDYYFLKVKNGQSIIIPLTKVNDKEKLYTIIIGITQFHNIKWNIDTNWTWK